MIAPNEMNAQLQGSSSFSLRRRRLWLLASGVVAAGLLALWLTVLAPLYKPLNQFTLPDNPSTEAAIREHVLVGNSVQSAQSIMTAAGFACDRRTDRFGSPLYRYSKYPSAPVLQCAYHTMMGFLEPHYWYAGFVYADDDTILEIFGATEVPAP